MLDKKLIILVGPSGSGKTTIGEALSRKGIAKLITTTTRQPRDLEQDGVDYYFRSIDDLEDIDFVERTTYNGNHYGLTRKEVEEKLQNNDIVHVSLDQSGAHAVKKAYPKETVVIFIPINKQLMMKRMEKRGDSPAKIRERILFSEQTKEFIPPPETDFIIENIEVDQTASLIIEKVSERQKSAQ